MALRVLVLLALICGVAAILLFFLHAFSYLIAVALAVVFGLGALVARVVQRSPTPG
jgi:Na+-translocating ferredoxin:NAD+ oxidoreductase RnfD subunit